jgi:hypothetical protein
MIHSKGILLIPYQVYSDMTKINYCEYKIMEKFDLIKEKGNEIYGSLSFLI